MPSPSRTPTRRALLAASGSTFVLLAGCQTTPPADDGASDSTGGATQSGTSAMSPSTVDQETTSDLDPVPTPSQRPSPPDGPASYPAPPQTLDENAVEAVVLAYEAAWIENALADETCLESYGAGGIVTTSFEIVDRGPAAVLVDVRHPMTMTGGSSHVDGYTLATYYVSPERIVRVEGTAVSAPCS